MDAQILVSYPKMTGSYSIADKMREYELRPATAQRLQEVKEWDEATSTWIGTGRYELRTCPITDIIK